MDESLRQFVRERARDRCEFCRMPQEVGISIRFHVEHIRPLQHGGDDSPQNLALACPNCNWYKGPNLAGIDPSSDSIAPLFNPRKDLWLDHFKLVGLEIVGLTPTGRATVGLLRLNAADRLDVRQALRLLGMLDLGL